MTVFGLRTHESRSSMKSQNPDARNANKVYNRYIQSNPFTCADSRGLSSPEPTSVQRDANGNTAVDFFYKDTGTSLTVLAAYHRRGSMLSEHLNIFSAD